MSVSNPPPPHPPPRHQRGTFYQVHTEYDNQVTLGIKLGTFYQLHIEYDNQVRLLNVDRVKVHSLIARLFYCNNRIVTLRKDPLTFISSVSAYQL